MRVGLVGCGRWGRHILRDLRELGCDVEVVARSPETVRRATEGGATTIVHEVEQLDDVSGIVVATQTSSHADVVERALGFGVPVFCEKPLCPDPAEAARLAALAPDRLFVMDKWRYNPGVEKLAVLARTGALGAVLGLKTIRVDWGTSHDDVDAVWVLAPHDLAIGLEVLGEVLEPQAAVAETFSGSFTSLGGLLRNDGVWHSLEVSERSPRRERRVELHCEDGVAILAGGWDTTISIVRAGTSEPVEERVDVTGELPLLAELRAFVTHLEGGPPPRSSAAEGAAVVDRIHRLRLLAETQ